MLSSAHTVVDAKTSNDNIIFFISITLMCGSGALICCAGLQYQQASKTKTLRMADLESNPFFTTLRTVEYNPRREIFAEVFKPMHNTGRHKQRFTLFEACSLIPAHKVT